MSSNRAEREPGSWIGQNADRNTEEVHEQVREDAERVAVTANASEAAGQPQPSSVERPSSEAPDQGRAYDPEMTDEDEANIPPDSDADPNATSEAG